MMNHQGGAAMQYRSDRKGNPISILAQSLSAE